MVQDPRVTPLLHRLGGLYRDPNRVDRDASFVLKSSVGVHLQPGIAALVENNGQTSKCLVLQGTIAICFRGNTYQLLVDMFLPPGYPMRPPVCYVRLANPTMYLKENHAHVGRDGMVYLPYLSEWKPHSHNLVELVVAMSSVFSADPPVFTRTTVNPAATAAMMTAQPPTVTAHAIPTTAAATRVQQVPATSMMTMMGNFNNNNNNNSNNRYYDDSPARIQAQAEDMLAKEAEEANRAAEIARALEQQEQEQERSRKLQLQFEQQQFLKVKAQVSQKIRDHLQQHISTTQRTVQESWKDQHVLPQNSHVLHAQLQMLESRKTDLEQSLEVVSAKTKELQLWLEEAKENSSNLANSNATTSTAVSMDDLITGSTKLHEQIIRLEAENAALSDLLYCLDRRIFNHSSTSGSTSNNTTTANGMDCATFLKQVRLLAKRQFLVRAHLLKIKCTIPSAASF